MDLTDKDKEVLRFLYDSPQPLSIPSVTKHFNPGASSRKIQDKCTIYKRIIVKLIKLDIVRTIKESRGAKFFVDKSKIFLLKNHRLPIPKSFKYLVVNLYVVRLEGGIDLIGDNGMTKDS